jgi:hypothetical protein
MAASITATAVIAACASVLAASSASAVPNRTVDMCAPTSTTLELGETVDLVYGLGCAPDYVADFLSSPANFAFVRLGDIDGHAPMVAGSYYLSDVLDYGNGTGYVAIYSTTGTCAYTQYVFGPNYAGEQFASTAVGAGCPTSSRPTPIPEWVQGYGRHNATDACLDGWNASWELWPHGGTGGWVCTREVPSLG